MPVLYKYSTHKQVQYRILIMIINDHITSLCVYLLYYTFYYFGVYSFYLKCWLQNSMLCVTPAAASYISCLLHLFIASFLLCLIKFHVVFYRLTAWSSRVCLQLGRQQAVYHLGLCRYTLIVTQQRNLLTLHFSECIPFR